MPLWKNIRSRKINQLNSETTKILSICFYSRLRRRYIEANANDTVYVIISERCQNYQSGAVNNQLTYVGDGAWGVLGGQ